MKTKSFGNARASLAIMVALMTTYSFVCMSKNCFSAAMVFIVDEGLLTKVETGTITSVFYVAYAILQVVGGFVSDRVDPNRLMTVGILGAGAANLVIFFNQNYAVMLVTWTLNGILQFGVWPACFKIMSTVLHEKHRDVGMYIASFGYALGAVASYLLAALVPNWRDSFLISGVLLLALGLVWELLTRVLDRYRTEEETAVEVMKVKTEGDKSLFKLVLSSGVGIVFILALIRCMFDLGIKSLTPTLINESYAEVDPTLATVLNIIVLVAGVVGPTLAHVIYPRFFKSETTASTVLFLVAIPLMAVTLFVGTVNYWVMLAVLSVVEMLMTAISFYIGMLIPARFNKWGKGGTIAGIINALAALGIVAANSVSTAIAEAFGWVAMLGFWLVLMVLCTVLSLVTVPMWKRFLKNDFYK